MQRTALLLLLLLAAGSCSSDDSGRPGVPDDCRTRVMVDAGTPAQGDDGGTAEDGTKGTPYDTQRVAADVAEGPSGATVDLAFYGAYDPGKGPVTDDLEVPEAGRALVVSLEAPEGLAKGESFVEDAASGEPMVTSATLWDGTEPPVTVAASVTITDLTDRVICGSIEVDGDVPISGTFQAPRE